MPIKGGCHCGAIQFEVAEAPTKLTDCNCSFCSKRGALVAYYPLDRFRLTTAPDRVRTYQWGDYMGTHHFCGVCGVGTHSQFPDYSSGQPDHDKATVVVNARMLDDIDLAALPVVHVDGRAH